MREVFTKRFTGDNAWKRYGKELKWVTTFAEFSPKVLSTNDEIPEINYEHVQAGDYGYTAENLKLIAQVLGKIHRSQPLKTIANFEFRMANRYLNANDSEISKAYKQISDKVLGFKFGITHGDFRMRNVLITPNREVKVVDWEFCGTSALYWDLAVFLGDMMHSRFHGKHQCSPDTFMNEYMNFVELSAAEVELCYRLGGMEIIMDHIQPRDGEPLPIPRELFQGFDKQEKEYLLKGGEFGLNQ